MRWNMNTVALLIKFKAVERAHQTIALNLSATQGSPKVRTAIGVGMNEASMISPEDQLLTQTFDPYGPSPDFLAFKDGIPKIEG